MRRGRSMRSGRVSRTMQASRRREMRRSCCHSGIRQRVVAWRGPMRRLRTQARNPSGRSVALIEAVDQAERNALAPRRRFSLSICFCGDLQTGLK